MSASTLRKVILSLGTIAAMIGPALGTARADDDHWRHERHWRHEGWERRHGPYSPYRPPVVYYGPATIYAPPVVYPPPVVVYSPPPGISIVVPLRIR